MILLDSIFIVAYLNEADDNRSKAFRISEALDKGKYVTPVITDYIFNDVITTILMKVKT